MKQQCSRTDTTIILGAGLAGLSAAYVLTKAGLRAKVFEKDSTVGGLSKTIINEGFRFDLGGHRFFTKDEEITRFVKDLMGDELISVNRSSKIYMRGKYFNYPLKPLNAIFGMGIPTTFRILSDYGLEKIRRLANNNGAVSLEDWVVRNFGRTMFNIYFKEYSEKVWGIRCDEISAEWVAQRIKGLSLGKAIKNAFFRLNGKDLPTLADSFLYPKLGIGRISDRLKEEIVRRNEIFTETRVERINHSDFKIESVEVRNHNDSETIYGKHFISSMPLTELIRRLSPSVPQSVLDAALRLRYRDIIIVAIMIDRERVTDQTWIYLPEKKIPFGRIHEPTNWSPEMAPFGKTIMVMEYFSFEGDEIWNKSDEELKALTVRHLEELGFINRCEVLYSIVVRTPKAYPLFKVGYKKYCDKVYTYLGRFKNLYTVGRTGMFRYYNMDHAIKSGIETAEKIIRN